MDKLQSVTKVPNDNPLLLACIYQNIEQAIKLLESGSNPNVVDSDRRTPLREAVQNCNKELVSLLLKHHANPNTADKNGRTPYHIVNKLDTCPQETKEAIEDLLIEHGAKANYYPLRLLKRGLDNIDDNDSTPLWLAKSAVYLVLGSLNIILTPVQWIWDRVEHKIVEDLPWLVKSVAYSALDALKKLVYIAEATFITSTSIISTEDAKAAEPVKGSVPLPGDLLPETFATTMWSAIYSVTGFMKMIGSSPYYGMKKFFDWSDEKLEYRTEHNGLYTPLFKQVPAVKQEDVVPQKVVILNDKPLPKATQNIAKTNAATQNVIIVQNDDELLAATRNQNIELVKMLLVELKIDPNRATQDGRTPLREATQRCNKELVELLLKHKADPTIADKHGDTPLHIANYLYKCPTEIVEMLITAGANTRQQANDGRMASDEVPLDVEKNTVVINDQMATKLWGEFLYDCITKFDCYPEDNVLQKPIDSHQDL